MFNKVWNALISSWGFISNLHVKHDIDELKKPYYQLINQYSFLVAIIFLHNAFRDLAYGLTLSFVFLCAIAILDLYVLFFTRLFFKLKVLFVISCISAFVIFFFSSHVGFESGIFIYYFALLSVCLLLFRGQSNYYLLILYGLVICLFLADFFTGFNLFFNPDNVNISLIRNTLFTCFVHTIALFFLCANFLIQENKTIRLFYTQKKRKGKYIVELTDKLASNNLTDQIESLVDLAVKDDNAFLPKFDLVFPSFKDNLRNLNPKMTSTEYKICALLYLKFSTKDISTYTFTSIRTVQTHKNRIRRNFNIPSDLDLYDWIETI